MDPNPINSNQQGNHENHQGHHRAPQNRPDDRLGHHQAPQGQQDCQNRPNEHSHPNHSHHNNQFHTKRNYQNYPNQSYQTYPGQGHKLYPTQGHQIYPNQNTRFSHRQTNSQFSVSLTGWDRWFPEDSDYHLMENINYHEQMCKAGEEGRRAYFGNLEWTIQPPDVALWLEGAGFNMNAVDIPKKPGKKPHHYCLVEFRSPEEVDAVITNLSNRPMRGRPVKIGPGDYKKPNVAKQTPLSKSGCDLDLKMSSLDLNIQEPPQATEAYGRQQNTRKWPDSSRLWVSGLPHTTNINQLEDFIKELFHGFHVESMSGIFASKRVDTEDGNNSYCFVDLPNPVEAKTAIRILNNRETSWGIARVAFAPEGSRGALQYLGINNENLLPGHKK